MRGKISFILFCIDYDQPNSSFDIELFKEVTDVLIKYFSDESKLDNSIRRAFFTIEVENKYEFYNYWWSYWHVGQANKRRLFDRFRELEYFANHDFFRRYFKKLVLKLISSTPDELINEFQPNSGFPNWKKRIIKESEILDTESKSNYIAIAEDDSYCYLLKSKRPRDLEGSIKID